MEAETPKKFIVAEPLVSDEPDEYAIEEMLDRMAKAEEIRNLGKPPVSLPF